MANNEVGEIYERPWGTYQTFCLEKTYQVKLLTVNPNGQLSLQKHFKRAEHWTVVIGQPTLTIGHESRVYQVNESAYIPIETIHRIENFTDQICQIVEVQIGNYLGEDDIVRLDDIYKR